MASSLELRDFQWASVRAVCEGLNRRSVFALADEVGLGKTLVCAEVANQLLAGSPKGEQHLIYYVAPSIELLHQNLRSIRRYLEGRCGGRFHISTSISRLSQVPRDLAEQRRRLRGEATGKGMVHVIGLSPGTSFNLRGAGQFSERIYLAALFGFRRQWENKLDVARFFWCLRGDLDLRSERRYTDRIESYASGDYLGALVEFRETNAYHELSAGIPQWVSCSPSEIRSKVAAVRHAVVEFLIKSTSPSLVVFDEWHKYKRTCFKNKLLERFLAQSRKSSDTRVLLVSATPFSVEFKEGGQGEAQLEEGGDLEGLLQMVWGKDAYQPHYQELVGDQQAYIDSVASYLKDPSSGDQALRARRDVYERHLRSYCSRTERPRVDIETANADGSTREGNWSHVSDTQSLANFLERFSRGEHPRSPILPMWSDGHGFPSHRYPGLEQHSKRDFPGLHWKVERLAKRLEEDFEFADKVHSFRYPPLWLPFAGELKNRKHLVFAEFLFVPEEVCRQLDSRLVRFGSVAKKKWTGSVLGYFPTRARLRVRTQESATEAIHFVLFYPFLVFELPQTERRRILDQKRPQIEHLIATEVDALALLREVETLLCEGGIDMDRLQYRWSALDFNTGIPVSGRFREYLRFVLFSDWNEWSLTAVLARVIGELWRSMDPPAAAERSRRLREFEHASVRLAAAVLRLFASPEAQTLKKRTPLRLPRAIPRRWNSHLRFAIGYAKQFNLEETLLDFAKLVSGSGAAAEGVLDEMAAAIGLRKGTSGNRFVRSFHDRKVGDAEYDGEAEETISLKSLRAAFNSPFPPYVLVSTSVGQEGLDFHRYCASVVHWSPPSSPSVLRQREGRVDRFQALQIRRVLQVTANPEGLSHDGMSPDFVFMRDGERINHADRVVWYLPFTAQEAAWNACLERMYYNDLLIGAPDPLSDERALLGAVGKVEFEDRVARFRALQTYAISLMPRSLSPSEKVRLKGIRSAAVAGSTG